MTKDIKEWEEYKKKVDADLRKNGMKSEYLEEYLTKLKKFEPEKFEQQKVLSHKALKEYVKTRRGK